MCWVLWNFQHLECLKITRKEYWGLTRCHGNSILDNNIPFTVSHRPCFYIILMKFEVNWVNVRWGIQSILLPVGGAITLTHNCHIVFAHLIVLHILLFCTFLFHCTFYSYFSFFTIYMLLCCVTLFNFYFYYFALSTERTWFDYISLLIIPCIIYYVTNKETWNLEPWLMRSASYTEQTTEVWSKSDIKNPSAI